MSKSPFDIKKAGSHCDSLPLFMYRWYTFRILWWYTFQLLSPKVGLFYRLSVYIVIYTPPF